MKQDFIDKLLEGEQLPKLDQPSEGGLKAFELKPSAEALEMSKKAADQLRWEEKREFTRSSLVPTADIVLEFSNQSQFAKQYIENISLGGLFVRTNNRPGLGAIVPIEFTIPISSSQQKTFRLQAKVCRQTETGLGLQFLNLTTEIRQDLENFVKSTLPPGASVVNQMRKASLERLEQSRQDKLLRARHRQKVLFRALIVVSLVVGNGFLTRELIQEHQQTPQVGKIPTVVLQGEEIPVQEIHSIAQKPDGKVEFRLEEGRTIEIDARELQTMPLPLSLQHSATLVKTIPAKKITRKVKNSDRRLAR